ncbi:hypothetical protein HPB50_026393 [Hyalomma asiaticum]|uniref:Uncharacterized protein n=1 Tax=Hyalomma asiaticum TaxID=266040 RepID=A0ACB7RVI7_HYAAI|nr:hypothetical protein HPB50_026393 [Hyalomma asiaticum]
MAPSRIPRFVTVMTSIAALGVGRSVDRLEPKTSRLYTGKDPDITDIETLVKRKGYPFERHRVVTDDGYIIELHRIPWGRTGNEATGGPPQRPPVLLMSGLLGFVLADHQYDVWIGNVRGNSYGKGHIKLKVRSKEFWNFSFHEFAVLDLPAQIDYVLGATERQAVPYVVRTLKRCVLRLTPIDSSSTSLNTVQVKAFAGLAPFNKLSYMDIAVLTAFTPFAEKYMTRGHEVFLTEVLPRGAFYMTWAKTLCGLPTRGFCSFVADKVGDLGSKYINEVRERTHLAARNCATFVVTVFFFFFFIQLVTSSRPRKFDYGPRRNMLVYGQRVPTEYRLSNVRTDVGIFWSKGDHVITPPNVEELIRELGPRVKMSHFIDDPYYTHVHFVVSLNNADVLFGSLLSFLDRYADAG